jgi:uncharacterized protein (TIGR02145 family)
MKKSLYLLVLLTFLFSSCEKEEINSEVVNGILTDPRDEQTYPVVELNGRLWMASDLNYETVEGSWVDLNYTSEGPQFYTRVYNFKWAQLSCPPGWRLPIYEEWTDMLLSYGGYQESILYLTGDNPQAAYEALVSGGESGFNC